MPDPLAAAARIACPERLALWSDRSAYQGVRRLGGGMAVYLDRDGMRTRTYEAPPAADGGPHRVRSALVTAVDRRLALPGALGADLSGGLDSGALTFLAARHTRATPLHAITYAHPAAPAADLSEATAQARLDPRIRHTVVLGGAATLPYQDLPAGEPGHCEPAPALISWRRAALRFEHAAGRGVAVHLTGEGGDALLGAHPPTWPNWPEDDTCARCCGSARRTGGCASSHRPGWSPGRWRWPRSGRRPRCGGSAGGWPRRAGCAANREGWSGPTPWRGGRFRSQTGENGAHTASTSA
ncbi:asparagine synthase-related protein [Nonomuraea sp. MG754425]|uniref:asparagine synthase-related protein n=1 Tax=Nonomuraea sp. MG754425 TaxID=2570319 RepID=UPI0027DFEC23|nr:asparagine synthase-related protein [Nonomuraea sp. MG754425]